MRNITDNANTRNANTRIANTCMEKKLQLIQQVRSRYSEDQYDLSNRERLLYGRETVSPYADTGYADGGRYAWERPPEPDEEPPSSMKLRFLLAFFLFVAVVFLDHSHAALGGITAEKIYSAISADYEDQLKDWVEAISGSVK